MYDTEVPPNISIHLSEYIKPLTVNGESLGKRNTVEATKK